MNIKRMDFLSPPIILFFFENRAHTSKIGGFLVLVMITLSLVYNLLHNNIHLIKWKLRCILFVIYIINTPKGYFSFF